MHMRMLFRHKLKFGIEDEAQVLAPVAPVAPVAQAQEVLVRPAHLQSPQNLLHHQCHPSHLVITPK